MNGIPKGLCSFGRVRRQRLWSLFTAFREQRNIPKALLTGAAPLNGTSRTPSPTFFVIIIIEQVNVNFNENSNCIYVLFSFLQLISAIVYAIIR